MAKRLALAAVMAALVAAGYLASGRLSGRGFGFADRSCTITAGRGADGVLEGEARCRWPVPAERIDALLAAWGDQDRHFGNVAESTILEQDGDRMLVRQVYHASGITDREVVMECTSEAIPGGRRYRWRKSADQSRSSGENVEVAVHEGFWDVVRGADGTEVVYHMRHLPGGSVPGFIVSMFLSSGMEDVLADLRRAAESQAVAVRDSDG